MRVRQSVLLPMVALVALACGDSSTRPPSVASVALTAPPGTIVVGSEHQLSASTLDAKSNVLAGRAVTWSSQNQSVATISDSGLLRAVGVGSSLITATSEGKAGSATIVVAPIPVARVDVSPTSKGLRVGDKQQLSASTKSATGATLTNREVTWTSDSAAIASVDNAGLVTAAAAGTTAIRATAEGQSGVAVITVSESNAPLIESISPAVLVPGQTATITGTRFGSAGNIVTFRGAVAAVRTFSDTQIIVTVPCVETGSTEVRVNASGATSAPFAHPVANTPITLGVGESMVFEATATGGCHELSPAAGARYLVTAFSAATSPNSFTGIELRGNAPTFGEPMPIAHAPIREAYAPSAGDIDPIVAAHEREHLRMLERNREDYVRLRAIEQALPSYSRVMEATAPPALGDMRSIYFTFSCGCHDTTRVIRGKAVHVGAHAIVWEDSANAILSSNEPAMADYYRRLGEVYDRDQHEAVRRYFADPLIRDAVTDNDGRVHMVFSQRLNQTGAAAYVTSCDQFTRQTAAGSNFGQFFYGRVPTTTTPNVYSVSSPDGWFAFMGRTVVHEVKHVASLSARIANGAPSFEQSWLEEGTARMAEEMWVRDSMHRTPWRSNTGFGLAEDNGLYCDFHLGNPTCVSVDPFRRPSWGLRRQFGEIRDKLVNPWDRSPYGDGTGQGGAVFYNTTWSLVRYAMDRHATSEAEFLKALTNATTSGLTNLTAVAGTSADQLIGAWGMALYTDDYPGMPTTNADLQFRTWNLRSVYAALHASWPSIWTAPYPVQPAHLSGGVFASQVPSIRGGAHAFFTVEGSATQPQVIHLHAAGGGQVGADARLAIARLK